MNVMIDEPLIAKHELEVVHMGRTCQNIQLFPGLDQSRSVNSIQEVDRLSQARRSSPKWVTEVTICARNRNQDSRSTAACARIYTIITGA